MRKEDIFDIAIIGGGPSGLMAATRASELGARVVVIEKNKKLGRKLLLTGNGRCNITNAEFNLKKMISFYGKKGKFLFSSFSRFGVKETIDFFERERVKTKIERGKRVFPKSNKAQTVLDAFLRCLRREDVIVLCSAKVHRFSIRDGRIKKIILDDKKEVVAKKYIVCTGGLAYPSTGSTGDGLRWARSAGHKVIKPEPVLVPLRVKEEWVKELQGLSLKNVEISFKDIDIFGELLFTHYGVSGPIILEASQKIGELKEEVKMSLDLKPALDYKKLDSRIQRDFDKYRNKLFKNSLDDLLPSKIIPVIIKLSGIGEDKEVNKITKEERKVLLKLLKNLEFTVTSKMGYDLAITNTGGVFSEEIDDKTMRSKKISNLYFAGDVIDISGPTGGFNLQLCWTTGYIAGESAFKENE